MLLDNLERLSFPGTREAFVSDKRLPIEVIRLQRVLGKHSYFCLSDRGGNDIRSKGDGDLTDGSEVMSRRLSRAHSEPP